MAKHIIHSTSGIELVRKLSTEGHFIFTIAQAKELTTSINLSPRYLPQALHHLSQSGWIVRLRRGLYAISGAAPGTPTLHEFAVAMALVTPAAISHLSAMSYHGLTEQIPRDVFVTTSARAIPRQTDNKRNGKSIFTVMGVAYQFIQVQPIHFFGVEEVWIHESKIKITDRERTLLDALMMPQYCGDFAEVLNMFEQCAPTLNLEKMINYALKLNTATIKRLGWILEHFNLAPKKQLDILQKAPIKGYRLLNIAGKRQGTCNTRWMIQVNL